MKKFEYIDSLRGIAIILVVLVHIGVFFGFPVTKYYILNNFLEQVIYNGRFGVQLFFVVSAYTLMCSNRNRINEKNKTRNYIIRRFFRIAPMYYLAIIYFTFRTFLGFDITNLDFGKIPIKALLSCIFFINGLTVNYTNFYVPGNWSISVEFIFYIVLLFLYKRITNINSAIKLFITSAIIAYFSKPFFIYLGIDFNTHQNFYDYNFIYQFPVFLLGIISFFFINENKNINKSSLLYILFFLLCFCYITIPYHILFSFIFVILLYIQSKYNLKYFSNRILAKIGEVSFSMYLVHFAIIYFTLDTNLKDYIYTLIEPNSLTCFIFLFIMIFVISFLISILTYKFIEKTGQAVGANLILKLNKNKL